MKTSIALALAWLFASPSAQVEEAARAPLLVPGIADATDAAVGDHFFIVVLKNGTAMSWGYNHTGQLGVGHPGPVAGSEAGKTMAFSVQGTAQPIPGLTDVVGVAAGGDHALAVRRDGSVWGWGSNGSGQLGLGKTNRAGSAAPLAVPGVTNAIAVAARGSASYALLKDGTVVGWGDPLWRIDRRFVSSETPIPAPGITHATAIRAGLPCLALLRDGSVMAWGRGLLGEGSPSQVDYSAIVVAQPAKVANIDDAIAIAAGASTSAVIRGDGSVWIWGDASMGRLGLGKPPGTENNPEQRTPAKIPGLPKAVDLAMGSGSSIVFADGTLRTWGDARLGATGRTGIERIVVPTSVPGVRDLVRVWANAYSNLGLTRDGHVLAWGSVYVGR